MEWWQILGYGSEDEAIARGESEEIFLKTRQPEPLDTRSQLEIETDLITEKVESYTPPGEIQNIVTGGGQVTKYIIVQGPGGRYVKQEDAAGTYTDATVQAEIDRLNKQRDEKLLEDRLNAAQQSIAVYTPQTVDVPYEPVESPSLTTKEEAKLRFPYLDERLIDVYVQGYIDTGSSELALLQMRSDPN